MGQTKLFLDFDSWYGSGKSSFALIRKFFWLFLGFVLILVKYIYLSNGQPSANNTTRLIKENAQREWKKSCVASRNNTLASWHSKKLRF